MTKKTNFKVLAFLILILIETKKLFLRCLLPITHIENFLKTFLKVLTLSLCILTEEVKKFKKIKVLTFTLCILKKEIKKKKK